MEAILWSNKKCTFQWYWEKCSDAQPIIQMQNSPGKLKNWPSHQNYASTEYGIFFFRCVFLNLFKRYDTRLSGKSIVCGSIQQLLAQSWATHDRGYLEHAEYASSQWNISKYSLNELVYRKSQSLVDIATNLSVKQKPKQRATAGQAIRLRQPNAWDTFGWYQTTGCAEILWAGAIKQCSCNPPLK